MSEHGMSYLKVFFSFLEETTALTPQERGNLIVQMLEYAEADKLPDPARQGNERFLFPLYKAQIDRDRIAWSKKADANRKNGELGGRPPKDKTQQNPLEPNKPTGFSGNPAEPTRTPKSHDNDHDNDHGNGYGNDYGNDYEETTTTTDSTYIGDPAGGGAGGGDLPPEILSYAREAARGAKNPAAYEAAVLDRIRAAGYRTIDEVRKADQQRKQPNAQDQQPKRIGGETIL